MTSEWCVEWQHEGAVRFSARWVSRHWIPNLPQVPLTDGSVGVLVATWSEPVRAHCPMGLVLGVDAQAREARVWIGVDARLQVWSCRSFTCAPVRSSLRHVLEALALGRAEQRRASRRVRLPPLVTDLEAPPVRSASSRFERLLPPIERGVARRVFRERSLSSVREWAGIAGPRTRSTEASRAASRRAAIYRPMTEAQAYEVKEILSLISDVKASSLAAYRSSMRDYEEACRTFRPALVPLPPDATTLGSWLIRRWKRGCKVQLSHTKVLVYHVLYFSRRARHWLTVTPRGIDPSEHAILTRIRSALDQLDDSGVTRSFPLICDLHRLVEPHLDLRDSQVLQWWVMGRVAWACHLRGDDNKRGRLRYSALVRLDGDANSDWDLIVPAGKCNAKPCAAAIPGKLATSRVRIRQNHDGHRLNTGHMLWVYLKQLGFDAQPKSAYLFPRIRADGLVDWSRPATVASLVEAWRGWLTDAGIGASITDRVTGHSFRSGGACDLYVASRGNALVTKRQGRWKSTEVFEVYVRLTTSLAAQYLSEVEAGQKPGLAQYETFCQAMRERPEMGGAYFRGRG